MKGKSNQRLHDCLPKMIGTRYPFIWLLFLIFAVSTLICWCYLLRLPDNMSSTVSNYPRNHRIPATRAQTFIEDVFSRRKQELVELCHLNETTNIQEGLDTNARMLDHIIIDDKLKLIYCYIPKVACTNWKRILLKLDGRSNYSRIEDIPSDSVHRDNVFVKLSDLQPKGFLADRIKNYDKLIFVRNPFERIVSAFKNKFEKNYNSSAYFKIRFGVTIQKMYRSVDKVSPTGDGVEFPEFVQYIIDVNKENPERLNEHWAPYSQLCFPCDIRYNLIGKYETLEQDASYILKKIRATEEVKFPKLVPSNTTDQVPQYLATLSDEQVSKLLKIYEHDFKIFNYRPIERTSPQKP